MSRTPGRWRVWSDAANSPEDGAYWLYGFRARQDGQTYAEHEANAALMQAAPQMLELLEEIQLSGALKDARLRLRLDRLLAKLERDDERR